jgi:hypothetical protein
MVKKLMLTTTAVARRDVIAIVGSVLAELASR